MYTLDRFLSTFIGLITLPLSNLLCSDFALAQVVINYDNNLLSFELVQSDLTSILKKIEYLTGVNISISSGCNDDTIRANSDPQTIETALHKILKDYNKIFEFTANGKLKSVYILGKSSDNISYRNNMDNNSANANIDILALLPNQLQEDEHAAAEILIDSSDSQPATTVSEINMEGMIIHLNKDNKTARINPEDIKEPGMEINLSAPQDLEISVLEGINEAGMVIYTNSK